MCHDISFSANTVEFISDILPNIKLDGQLSIDLSVTSHVLSMSNRKCLVIIGTPEEPRLVQFEWGLIADYMNTPEKIKEYRIQMANARSEKILDKKSVWYRIRKQRCLIAVDGIFEHREIKGWKNKVPYFIKLANRRQVFLPGFYNYSPIPDAETGELKGTFTVVTRPANTLMQQIHNHGPNKHRMPVFMQPEDALNWIKPDLSDEQILEMVNYEIPSEELAAWPVFTIRTTKERPDGADKMSPYAWQGLPPLGNDDGTPKTLF
ncbi:MAG: SOS response-associated peptidase family protein [Chitinophagales bacterium]|nr:SOS response-associated peptidase family protein [Chitinophagales bacterium]